MSNICLLSFIQTSSTLTKMRILASDSVCLTDFILRQFFFYWSVLTRGWIPLCMWKFFIGRKWSEVGVQFRQNLGLPSTKEWTGLLVSLYLIIFKLLRVCDK